MIKFNRTTILTAAGLGVALYFGIYFKMTTDSSYKVAKQFVENSEEVKKVIGPVGKVSLTFWGSSFSRNNLAGYELSVVGENGDARANIKVENKSDNWEVRKATLILSNGPIVVLKEEPSTID